MSPTRVLKCAECGAALPSENGPAIACTYCGAVNQTDRTLPLPAVDASPAGGEVSARLDVPRATETLDRPAPPRARRSGRWKLAVLGLVSLVGFVLISPSARCVNWVSAPFCEIDANGDGRPDLAMKARRFGGEKLFALDGRGGRVRWSAGALGTSGDEAVFCAGPAAVLTQHADLRIELFGSGGRLIASRPVTDKVKSVRDGPGCVEIALGDGTSLAVNLTSGESGAACPGAHPSAPSDRDTTQMFAEGGVTIGDVHLVEVPQGGTVVRVALRADRAGQIVWTRPTEIVHDGVHLVPTRTGVLIAGKRPDGHLHFAWVRATDGAVVYERPLPEDGDGLNDVWSVMVDSDDTAYVDVNSLLYAYDVQSGEARWHTGL